MLWSSFAPNTFCLGIDWANAPQRFGYTPVLVWRIGFVSI